MFNMPASFPVLPDMFAQRAVGPATSLSLRVGAVIRDDLNRILLERRSDCGWWGLPGGSLEVGETIIQTAMREVKEETGLEVEILRLVGVYSKPEERIVRYPDQAGGLQIIDVVVEGTVRGGKLTCSEESLELGYFDGQHLPLELIPPSQQPIKDVFLGVVGKIG